MGVPHKRPWLGDLPGSASRNMVHEIGGDLHRSGPGFRTEWPSIDRRYGLAAGPLNSSTGSSGTRPPRIGAQQFGHVEFLAVDGALQGRIAAAVPHVHVGPAIQ